MKKRNQLVSALLAGMLISGVSVATAHAAPQTTGTTAEATTESDANTAASGTEAGAAQENAAAEQPSEKTSPEVETAPESERPAALSDTAADGSAASSNGSAASADDSAASSDSASSADTNAADSTSPAADSTQSGTTDSTATSSETTNPTTTPSSSDKNDSTATENQSGTTTAPSGAPAAAAPTPSAGSKTTVPTTAPAAPTTPSASAGSAEANRSASSAQPVNRAAASAHTSANTAAQRTFSTAINSLVATPTTQQNSLQDGFVQIAKKYALANIGANQVLNIRESGSESGRVIGTLQNGGLCFIITDDDKDWVYVESGDVRGFVQKKYLLEGDAAKDRIEAAGGEDKFEKAKITVDPKENTAYRYSLYTTQEIDTGISANRQEMINYAMQYLGRPYVWGGEDLWNGSDCSGFVRGIYAKFGISLPRTSSEQSQAGTKVDAKNVKPGDLLFYSRGGTVYHVLMYIGNGQAINAQSSATGVVISNVDYSKVCWGCTYISDEETSSTQASSLTAVGQKAYQGDSSAQKQIIGALAKAADKEWEKDGLAKSVVIAQAIQESGWLSFPNSANGGIQASDNNVLGMAEDQADNWVTPWKLTVADRNVPQTVNGQTTVGRKTMRTYSDMESAMEDYAAYILSKHPDLKNSLNVDTVVNEGLQGYSTDTAYQTTIHSLIDKYNLTQYDSQPVSASANTVFKSVDKTNYTTEQLQLIWAIVAQEDDSSYEGALAVISSAMNRADINLGGYGANALAQLTAPSQYAYSIGNPAYYQRRLGGNVPDYVKQAVSDCLTKGARNHSFLSFRSTNANGSRTQIGGNWYF